MKLSKVFAGMSALAIAGMMTITASANSLTIATPSDKEWDGFAKYTNAEGKEDNDFFWGGSLTKGSDVTVKVNFEWTDKAKEANYTAFGPAFANGWAKIFGPDGAAAAPAGWANKADLTEAEDGGYVDADGNKVDYAWQDDGFLQCYNTELTSIEFTIPSSVVDTMYDNATAEDGFDGLIFQIGNNGQKITSVEFSTDGVQWASEVFAAQGGDETSSAAGGDTTSSKTDDASSKAADSSKADASSKAADSSSKAASTTGGSTNNAGGSTTTTPAAGGSDATDTSAATGATAGLVFAGIALAGAAVVASKRK